MAKRKSSQNKKHKASKNKALVPVVLSPIDTTPKPLLAMDGTNILDFSVKENEYYSREIIQGARNVFNLEKLDDEKTQDIREKNENNERFLAEGEKQIFALWHSIEALRIHNTLFVALFLISIGEILNKIKSTLPPHKFVKWRREVFHYKHERYLQQAQQLAAMGEFAKIYAAMGKKRLLALDHLRKSQNVEKCDALFEDNPFPEEVKDSLISAEDLKENPFPDSTEDLEGELLKEHTDAFITLNRLRQAGITFATFDQAYLLAAYNKNALGVKTVEKIGKWLNGKKHITTKKRWFDFFVMDKGKFPERVVSKPKSGDSLNQLFSNLISYCESKDFNDPEWLRDQKAKIDEKSIRDAYNWMIFVSKKLGIRFSKKRPSKSN
jgi:hypothetical protein